MFCFNPLSEGTVEFTFLRSALDYDISNYCSVEADLLGDNDEHARHQVYDVCEDGNRDRVSRVLQLAHRECIQMLYPYCDTPVKPQYYDNLIDESDEYVIRITFPKDFNDSSVKLLKEMLHEYMVCRVVADWLSIVKPSSQANWEDKLSQLRTKIPISLTSRMGSIRRKMSVF